MYVIYESDRYLVMYVLLDKGWELLGLLPKEELDRIDTKILNKYYKETVR